MTKQFDDHELSQIVDEPGQLWLVRGGPVVVLGKPCATLREALQQAYEHSMRGVSPGPIIQMPDDTVVISVEQIYRLW